MPSLWLPITQPVCVQYHSSCRGLLLTVVGYEGIILVGSVLLSHGCCCLLTGRGRMTAMIVEQCQQQPQLVTACCKFLLLLIVAVKAVSKESHSFSCIIDAALAMICFCVHSM